MSIEINVAFVDGKAAIKRGSVNAGRRIGFDDIR